MTDDLTHTRYEPIPSYEELKRAPYPYNELLPGTITFDDPVPFLFRSQIEEAINREFPEANAYFATERTLKVTFFLTGASDNDEEAYDSNSFAEILDLLDDLPIWANVTPDYTHDVDLRLSTDLDEATYDELEPRNL